MGVLPVVMINPSDIFLVSDAGEGRRKFVNSVISQLNFKYMTALQKYNRILSQRNRALKEYRVNTELISIYDKALSEAADIIYKSRKEFCEQLSPLVEKFYKILSGDSEQVFVRYRSDVANKPLSQALQETINKDLINKYTGVGIHRDDFIFYMNDDPIRKTGSQGQQKSFLVALKFAQYEIMKHTCTFAPILLLDDVFDKLDINRISNLLSLVAGNDFGQIFITDSNKVRMAGIVDKLTDDRAYLNTVDGEFFKVDDADEDTLSRNIEEGKEDEKK